MKKEKWVIDKGFLIDMGINPADGVKYLESKKANTIDPVHVTALEILKQQPKVVSSS